MHQCRGKNGAENGKAHIISPAAASGLQRAGLNPLPAVKVCNRSCNAHEPRDPLVH
jgi:hypothetical protein